MSENDTPFERGWNIPERTDAGNREEGHDHAWRLESLAHQMQLPIPVRALKLCVDVETDP